MEDLQVIKKYIKVIFVKILTFTDLHIFVFLWFPVQCRYVGSVTYKIHHSFCQNAKKIGMK